MLGASSPGHYGNQNNFDTFFSICCRNDCGKVVTRCKFTAQEIQHLVHFVTKKDVSQIASVYLKVTQILSG